ncbi:amino acid adenylation domain-containing protein, partial [Streptomyces sp. B226SN101]
MNIRRAGHDPLPATAAQRGVQIAEKLDGDAGAFHCGAVLELTGHVETDQLRRAVARAVADAEALRVRFAERDDRLLQHVLAPAAAQAEAALAEVDLSGARDPAAAADAWAADRLATAPALVGDDPLVAHALLRLSPSRHRLVLTYHHAVLDGYGQSLHTARIAEVYTALTAGRAVPESTAGSLAALVAQDRAYEESVRREDDRAYWLERLAGADTPGSSRYRGAGPRVRSRGRLTEEQTRPIVEAARAAGVPWTVLVIALVAAHRRAAGDQDEVLFGLPLTTRVGRAALTTPGMLANELPLRLTVARWDTVADVVGRVRGVLGPALRHQRYRGEELRRELGWTGAGFGALMLNVMAFDRTLRFGSVEAVTDQLSTGPVHGLTLNVHGAPDGSGGLALDLHAHADEHSEAELAAIRDDLIGHLLRASADPGRPVGAMLPRTAHRDAAPDESLRGADVPRAPFGPNLAAAFERRVAHEPTAPAVVEGTTRMTAGELNAGANRLARLLLTRGVGPESPVGLHLPRSLAQVTAVLAVTKAGGAYVPLDPDYPAGRIEFVLSDTAPAVVVTTTALASALPQTSAQVVALDDADVLRELAAVAQDDLTCVERPAACPESAAYIIHTSGSTGRPKGVVGVHAGVLNRVRWFGGAFPHREGEAVLGKTSLSFIDGTTEFFGALLNGLPLVLAPAGAVAAANDLTDLVERHGIGRVTVVPSLLGALLDGPDAHRLGACRLWVSSGEALTGQDAERFARALPDATLLNLYGSSEATGDSLFATCEGPDVALGTPIWNTTAHVLDDQLRPVRAGETGELYLSGAGLARGYLGSPDLTAERFVANPFGSPRERMYRTGDRVRVRGSGGVEFVGRTDAQVKLRGHRVELAEVEAALLGAPGVGGAAA